MSEMTFEFFRIEIQGPYAFAHVHCHLESPDENFGHANITFELPIPMPGAESFDEIRARSVEIARRSLQPEALLDLVRSGRLP